MDYRRWTRTQDDPAPDDVTEKPICDALATGKDGVFFGCDGMNEQSRCCYSPARLPQTGSPTDATVPRVASATETSRARDEVILPGGLFLMGDAFGEGYRADGEGPVHEVELAPFSIDRSCVSVAEFAEFVAETGYRTEAEQFGYSAVFHLYVQADTEDIVGTFGVRWWLGVRGADWCHPYGPKSNTENLQDHPVVHVSHNDALAYCAWAARDLPTEAEWEYAARAGEVGLRYPWGNELEPCGEHRANVWQGDFPQTNTGADGWKTTAPVRSYEPNGFGLYQMIGNVWEWCGDWFNTSTYEEGRRCNPRGPNIGSGRVTRGGSYLCHHSYCSRYRVAARSFNTPDSSTGNTGFRTVRRG